MNRYKMRAVIGMVIFVGIPLLTMTCLRAGELRIGAAQADITPDRSIALSGQFTATITARVKSPVTVNALALEWKEEGKPTEAAIIVSGDVCIIREGVQEQARMLLAKRLPDFNTKLFFLAATHTHKAPVMDQDTYGSYDGAKMEPDEYLAFMLERIADAAEQAWNSRKPGAVAWGMGHAVVAQNRRAVYANGAAVMYGKTDQTTFRGLEGYEDHTVDSVFFLNEDQKPLAIMVAVPCPAQTDERGSCGNRISADFWHDVRTGLCKTYGDELVVLGFVGPAGDQSPHLMIRNKAETRMQKLRKLSRTQEMGRRIVNAVNETWDVVKSDVRTDLPFVHRVELFDLPTLPISEAEYAAAKTIYSLLSIKRKQGGSEHMFKKLQGYIVQRFEAQQKGPLGYETEMHVLRLGDVVIATNPFELFTDYGVQIQARSPAEQTILLQLTSPRGKAGYLPTPRALAGKGYSAIPLSCLVGPEGGQMLVDRTVQSIKEILKEGK